MADRQNEFIDKAMEAYEKAVTAYQNLDLWTKVDSTSAVTAFTQESETGLDTLKVEFFVDKPPTEVLPFLYNNYEQVFKQASGDLCGFYNKIHEFSDKARVSHSQFVPPAAVVEKRQTVGFEVLADTAENTVAMIQTSCDFPAPEAEGIMAEVAFQVCIAEPVGGDASRTHFVMVLSLDPKGSIPQAIANAIMAKRVAAWEQIKQTLDGKL